MTQAATDAPSSRPRGWHSAARPPTDPLEPHFDPWTDTVEQRGQERDDPFDNVPESPFGIAPESVGVPNMVRSAPRTGPSRTSRPRFARAIVLVLLLIPLLVAIAPRVQHILSTWLG